MILLLNYLEIIPLKEYLLKLKNLNINLISSIFVLEGEALINNKLVTKGDFIIIENEELIKIDSADQLNIFEITSPKTPTYPTYFQRFG